MSKSNTFIKSTEGVKVTVIPFYEEEVSDVKISRYVHSYHIQIFNERQNPCQLLTRKWRIFDSNGVSKIIKGEGVVGEQPIIQSNEDYAYSSWCPLTTTMGNMSGYFFMKDVVTNEEFAVEVPKFYLIADLVKN